MKPNRFFAVAMVGAFLILGAQVAISQTQEQKEQRGFRPGMRGRQGGFMHMRMLRALNLSEDQQEQVREFQRDQFEKTKEERDALADAQHEYQEAVAALETVNDGDGQSKVRKAAKKLADKQAALSIASAGQRTEFLDYLNSILDPEQWEELQKLRTEMEQFRNGRFERRKEQRQDLR